MKVQQRKSPSILQRLFKMPVEKTTPDLDGDGVEPRYTLRLEDGVIQINNISGSPESVTYTLMAQNPDGSTKLVTKQVALAPFQVVEDQPKGLNVVAAWTKN